MNGAEALLRTLVANGIDTCFANPGTTELDIVAAFDAVPEMRCIPTLFEGVAVGAADGYSRIAGKPAFALLHTGAGLSNGLSNILNAAKSHTPLLVVVGDHPVRIRENNAVIASGVDLERVVSAYGVPVERVTGSTSIVRRTAAAVAAARTAPGGPAVLVMPADASWLPAPAPAVEAVALDGPAPVSSSVVRLAATILRSGEPTALLLHGNAVRDETSLRWAAGIAAATGCRVLGRPARITRGAGRTPIEQFPYPPSPAIEALKGLRHVILVGAHPPVMPWAYPHLPETMTTHPESQLHVLARPDEDGAAALAELAAELGAAAQVPVPSSRLPEPATGPITPQALGASIAALLPEDAIVVNESVTTGRPFWDATADARPHDWISNLGGALGVGQPLAVGCAVAAPGRKVVLLQSDGAGMYAPQSLWTMAREGLDVLVVIFANRTYEILRRDLDIRGRDVSAGSSKNLLDIGRPDIDWVTMAGSLGVPAVRATTMEEFNAAMAAGVEAPGPRVLEVVL